MDIPRALRQFLPPDRVSDRAGDLEEAAHDESSLPPHRPEAVVWPQSTEEVALLARWATREGVALTARGAGTSLEGNPIPVEGGVVVSFRSMDRLLEVSPADGWARTQPGIVYAELNRRLKETGLFFPPSPGGSSRTATVGGMVANNASGLYAYKYGATRDHVRALTVVTASGETLRLGARAPKSSAGYHLLGLFVGSEGTLGLITEVTLSLAPQPESRRSIAYGFPSEEAAAQGVAEVVQNRIDLAAVEFVDARCMEAVSKALETPLPSTPCLFLEAQGSPPRVEEALQSAERLMTDRGGTPLEVPGGNPWTLREQVTDCIRSTHPGAAVLRTDVGVPVSHLVETFVRARALADSEALPLFAFGHAGLGILHLLMPVPPAGALFALAKQAKDRFVAVALAMGGTCSAEHGIGLGNRRYLKEEHAASLEWMRKLKGLFDPSGILNPGKIF